MAFDPQEHLIKVKGGQLYLEVRWRLIWFRELHPDASLEVELTHLDLNSKLAIARATVTLPNGTKATEIGSETEKDFPAGWVEKAATKAVGRALAALGFGTQFALELEEGERLADSPVNPKNTAPTNTASGVASQTRSEPSGHGNGADHTPAEKGAQTPAQGFVEAAAEALTPPARSQASAPVGTPVTDVTASVAQHPPVSSAEGRPPAQTERPRPQVVADPHAALRAEVIALCSADGAALEVLRKAAGGKVPQEWTEEQLRKALPWLRKRVPRSTQLSGRIAAARTDEELHALLGEAQEAKDQRAITQVEYLGLHREAQTRKAALSGPLTAGAGIAS